ncbi:MAG: RDD family protein [Inquilinaceae bacterium]
MDQSLTADRQPVMANETDSGRYAGFGRRFVALVIDQFITSIFTIIFTIPYIVALNQNGSESTTNILYSLLITIAYMIYYIVPMSSRWQATIGKRIMGIYVIRTSGKRIGPAFALGRLLSYAISTLPLYIGFLMPLWMKEKQALHDLVCGTRVVRERF